MTDFTSSPVSLLAESYQLGDRNRGDGCPGALKMHEAKDGGIGRVRVAGGQMSPERWEALADMADRFGDGNIHVTTRGNLQVRGIQDTAAFAEAAQEHGFLPSRAHDRVRNIIASPLAPELLPLVAELDAALLADDVVTGLSGRTLFGLDSGVGDIVSRRPDFGVFAHDGGFQLVLGGVFVARRVERGDVAATLVQAARRWQEIRGSAWRVAEKPEVHGEIIASLDAAVEVAEVPFVGAVPGCPVGWLPQSDGLVSLGAGVRFGQLSSQLARMIAVTGARTTVTPWHSIVLHDVDEHAAEQIVRVLAPLGLIFDANSTWLRVSACTGIEGCEKSLSDTRGDAAQAVASLDIPQGKVHFSGCERRCGHPLESYTDYLATGDGEYEVSAR